jgi:predicted O-methyltransferase YrrM
MTSVAAPPVQSAIDEALATAATVDLSWLDPASANAWTLAPDALRFLSRLVEILEPQHVLEFGSGLSTCVLARAAAGTRLPCAVTSVEHDLEFGRATGERLRRHELRAGVRLHFAPLVARHCLDRILTSYALRRRRFASARPADLVLIDGPPSVLGGREGTLYQVMEFARPGTLVLLDDAGRAQEGAALSRWRTDFDRAIDVRLLPGFARGLAAIVVERPLLMKDLWAEGVERAARDIASVVPASGTFILVDDAQWGIDVSPRRAIPFLERDGIYVGPPADDVTAIAEVERSRQAGAGFIVFGRPARWWLDHYAGLTRYLRGRFPCVQETDHVIVFDLRA